MSDEARIRRHLERLREHGWPPVAGLAHKHDPRWTDAERENAAHVGRVLRWFHVSDRCLLVEDGGRRSRITSLDDALTLVDESPAPFVISCERDGDWYCVYYDGGGTDPAQFLLFEDDPDPIYVDRVDIDELDWVAAFRALARRKASLLRVFGSVFIDPLPEDQWRELWIASVSGSLWRGRKRWWRAPAARAGGGTP